MNGTSLFHDFTGTITSDDLMAIIFQSFVLGSYVQIRIDIRLFSNVNPLENFEFNSK